jgi:WD40 repeat protein
MMFGAIAAGAAVGLLGIQPAAHTGGVLASAWRPDGRVFATSGWDNTIRVWLADGTLRRTHMGHSSHVTDIAYSPDGKTLASVDGGGNIMIWPAEGGPLRARISGGTSYLSGVAFGPDGALYASGYDNRIKAWSLSTKKIVQRFTLPSDGYDAAVSRDGRWVASTGPGGVTLSTSAGERKVLWGLTDGDWGASIDFNPKTNQLLSCIGHKRVELLEREEALAYPLPVGERPLEAIWAPDGDLIATALYSGEVTLFRNSMGEKTTLAAHRSPAGALSFSPNGEFLISGDDAGFVALWSVSEGRLIKILTP